MRWDGVAARLRRALGRGARPIELEEEATRPCPHCEQPIARGATVCLHCEREVVPLMSYAEFARRYGSPHSGGPPHTRQEES